MTPASQNFSVVPRQAKTSGIHSNPCEHRVPNEDDSTLRKVEAVAEIISRAGDEPTAALFILIETLESSTDPKVYTNRAKHVAFSHCGELHVYDMIDAQIAEVERQFLPRKTPAS